MSDVVLDARAFLEGIDDTPADQGGGALPKGVYPAIVDRIVTKEYSQNNVPRVAYMIKVSEGDLKGKTAFLDMYLGASKFEAVYENRVKVGDKERSDEEFKEKLRGAQGRVKGVLEALELPYKNTPSVGPMEPEYIFQCFGIDNMIGRGAMFNLSVDNDGRNKLSSIRSLNHPKEGIEAWRAKQAKLSAKGISL